MITVWESDISATIFIFRLKCSADAAFLSFWSSYFITWPRCKRSFVSNNWCLVWTGSAFPQSFLSCKQSDAERKDFVNIPEQGHSWFYTSLRLFCFFRRRDGLSQSRVERKLEILQRIYVGPINVFASPQFRSLWSMLFP